MTGGRCRTTRRQEPGTSVSATHEQAASPPPPFTPGQWAVTWRDYATVDGVQSSGRPTAPADGPNTWPQPTATTLTTITSSTEMGMKSTYTEETETGLTSLDVNGWTSEKVSERQRTSPLTLAAMTRSSAPERSLSEDAYRARSISK